MDTVFRHLYLLFCSPVDMRMYAGDEECVTKLISLLYLFFSFPRDATFIFFRPTVCLLTFTLSAPLPFRFLFCCVSISSLKLNHHSSLAQLLLFTHPISIIISMTFIDSQTTCSVYTIVGYRAAPSYNSKMPD